MYDGNAVTNDGKKKKYAQKFVDSWLQDPLYKSWIKKVRNQDGDFQPLCEPCNTKISCAKTALLRHQESRSNNGAMSRSSFLKKSHKTMESFLGPTD